jgi:hypothetical protein
MKKTINLLLMMTLLFRCTFLMPLASFGESDKLNVPSLLSIPVSFAEPVNSNEIASGDVIPVVINKDIYVEDTLVFKRGTDGVVFIDSRKKGGRWGSAGKIKITKGKLTDVFGTQHDVKISENEKGDGKPSAKILPAIGAVVFWPLLLVGLRKGDQAVIPAGRIVYAFTTDSVKVDTSKN